MAPASRQRAAGGECAEAAPGLRRAARRREAEARILAAAEEVFAETGFSGATTAAIARRAGLPKANLHYYFGTKETLYRRVLEDILDAWLATGDQIAPEADPAAALGAYIAAKVEYSRRRPLGSKVFANELLHGGAQIADYLRGPLRRWIAEKSGAIEAWVATGRMRKVEPAHLFFVIWAATQTYADFDVQVRAVLGRRRLRPGDYRAAADLITRMVLGGCGVRMNGPPLMRADERGCSAVETHAPKAQPVRGRREHRRGPAASRSTRT